MPLLGDLACMPTKCHSTGGQWMATGWEIIAEVTQLVVGGFK